MVFTTADTSLRDRQWLSYVGAPAGSEMSIYVTLTSGTPIVIGSVSATVDSIYVQSGANMETWIRSGTITDIQSAWVRSGNITDVQSSWVRSGNIQNIAGTYLTVAGSVGVGSINIVPPILIGGVSQQAVPTEYGTGSVVNNWIDGFGRQIIYGTDLSQGAMSISDIAPALTQTINITELNAVGSLTGSNVGAWVNMSDYFRKTIYFKFTGAGTGSQMNVFYDASHDAGSTIYNIGSKYYTTTNTQEFVQQDIHHEYMRAYTSGNNGGTLSVTFTGRGG